MINFSTNRAKTRRNVLLFGLLFVFVQCFAAQTFAQKSKPQTPAKKVQTKTAIASNLPKVTQIDEIALKNLLKREGENAKPLLINFWATWCDPCREEFPELVKINDDYKGKIDFITISLDDLAEINHDVPKFLVDMKAKMPAYLLKTEDEEAAIASVSKDWQGGLPFTVLINEKGEIAYIRQGKIKPEIVRNEIDKIIKDLKISKTEKSSSQESLELTDEDKFLIIKSVFEQDQQIKSRLSQQSEKNLVINLSEENISSDFLPKFPQVEFRLLNVDNLENYKGKPLSYQKFEKFEVKNFSVIVVFSKNDVGGGFFPSKSVVTYEYQKINGKWFGKIIGLRIDN